jgi:hypothetical protein
MAGEHGVAVVGAHQGEAGEGSAAVAPVGEIEQGDLDEFLVALLHLSPDGDQAVLVAEGERAEEDGVDHGEDGRGGADPQPQGEHGRQGESGALERQAQGVPEVAQQVSHRGGDYTGAGCLYK